MKNKRQFQNWNTTNSNISSEQQLNNISNIIENEEDFISLIKKITESEFEALFPKILNLPKIDFLNQLMSNVTFILSDQFSTKILKEEKYISTINSTYKNFDKKYNKFAEELTEGWDLYNFEKMSQIQKLDSDKEKLNSFYLTNFRKHCHKTQNIALHQCDQNGKTGKFIIIYHTSFSSSSSNIYVAEKRKKIKYLICDNCRRTYFIKEFHNFCKYCNISYLCSTLIKEEDENFLPATLNPPHCETFVNEELLCQKCKNVIYIDIKNSTLKCKNKKCDYCVSIENNANINFKCKICQNNFYSNVKIYNPIEVIHFQSIINKALLYKRKAFPGKLSCCKEIREKKTDFYHKKSCRGKLYMIEYNKKLIIICSKCKAVNQYSKYIWICPECGLHFRDKKSEEHEMKIRKAKSTSRLFKSNWIFPDLDEEPILNSNKKNKKYLADLINKRKSQIENYNTDRKRKRNQQNLLLCDKKLSQTDGGIDRSTGSKDKKQKRMYIFNKILPWGKTRNNSPEIDKEENTKINDKNQKSEKKKDYYDKKVSELISPISIPSISKLNLKKIEIGKGEKEKEKEKMCKSGRAYYKYNNNYEMSITNNSGNEINKKSKEKSLYVSEFNINEKPNYKYDYLKSSKEKNNNKSSLELKKPLINKKSPESKNIVKDINLKCKKFVPVKLNYQQKKSKEKEQNQEQDKAKVNKDNSNNNNCKKVFIFQSQRMKIPNRKDEKIKKEIINQKKYLGNKLNNNNNYMGSFQSKETTCKDSVGSHSSLISHSPPKEVQVESKKNNYKIVLNKNNDYSRRGKSKENKLVVEEEEDGIIPPEKINPEEDILIEDSKIKADRSLYGYIQRRLKKILEKGKLPRFDLGKFTIEKQIGDGSYGTIFSVFNNKTKKKYAMKKLVANNINSMETFLREFEIAHHNKHPLILDIKGINLNCFDQTTYVLYVLMDLAEKDWEMEIINRQITKNYYNEKELILILKQLSNTLYFLQKERNVAHRDIKLENILIFKNKSESMNKYGKFLYKLCDFGEAKNFSKYISSKHKTLRGTELYMSPLLYNGLINEAVYVDHNAYKSDVFSLGCCIIIATVLNFDIINEIRELKEQNKISRYLRKQLYPKYSEKLIDILLKMINFNEDERIDFIKLEELIESTF